MNSLALVLWLAAQSEAPSVTEPAGDPPPAAETPAPAPSYPLHLPAARDFAAPGDPLKLVDLRYRVRHTFDTEHALAARFRVRDLGYVGAGFEGDRRTLTAARHRLAFSVAEEAGDWTLSAGYRHRRFLVATRADHVAGSLTEKAGWAFGPSLAVRLNGDLELLGEAQADTRNPFGHSLRRASLGFLWQHGASLEASGAYAHERVGTEGGFENTVGSARAALVAQLGPTELEASGLYQDTSGRFPRRDLDGALDARIRVSSRLLVAGGARFLVEDDVRAHDYRASVTWFGRRFYLPRSGPAAERSAALARQATRLGYNERRVFTEEERRAQRERLSLTPGFAELRGAMEDLYAAQVDERQVPLLGLSVLHTKDHLPNFESLAVNVLVGVPWPLAWPWKSTESKVPFLRLDLGRERVISGPSHVSHRTSAALTVALNREMDLVLRWRRDEPTPLDIIRELIGARRTIEVSYVYAFGR
jgi:hypothetical protein